MMDTRRIALALLFISLLSGLSFADCGSYNESCAGGCCTGLVCDPSALVCTQPSTGPGAVCTNMPASYVFVPSSEAAGGPGSPVDLVQQLAGGTGNIASSSGIYKVGWFSDWTLAGILGVAASISIIALAAIVGRAFNLPEVKAFADAEMMQAVISVLLIFGLLGLVGFFDAIAKDAMVGASLPLASVAGEPSYVTAAKYYLETLYNTSSQYSYDQLKESIRTQKAASQGISMQLNFWQLLYAGTNIRVDAGMSIMGERAGIIFETVSKLMASIYAQRYFIDVISFGIAPIFLLLGIVLRTFFFTRKLGGLMLAIAISLFIVYPLCYAFSWYTLNVTVYGERAFTASDPACPNECTARYPAAFYVTPDGKLMKFETTQEIMMAGINNSNWDSGDTDGNLATIEFPGLVACRNLSKAGLRDNVAVNQCKGCPDYCRDVPFPANIPGCSVQACSACNAGCKIMRVRSDCRDPNVCPTSCSQDCRTTLPVENKCFDVNEGTGGAVYQAANLAISCAGCSGCPYWCRFLNASNELVYSDEEACTANTACRISNCPVQCMYKTNLGKNTNCETSCSYSDNSGTYTCPTACRVDKLFPYSIAGGTSADNTWMMSYDIGNLTRGECTSDPKIVKACNNCLPGCRVPVPAQANTSKCAVYPENNYQAKLCHDCPEYCRWQDYLFVSPYSNLEKASDNKPYMCTTNATPSLNCDQSPAPAACEAGCFGTDYPPTCRAFAGGFGADYCLSCPMQARTTLQHTNNLGASDYNGPPLLGSTPPFDNYACSDAYCSPACKTGPTIVPNASTQSEGLPTPLSCNIAYNNSCDPAASSGNCCTGGYSCRLNEDVTDYNLPPGLGSGGADLRVGHALSPVNVVRGDSFNVEVTTANRGDTATLLGSTTRLTFDGGTVDRPVAGLVSGGSQPDTATLTCNTAGTHQLTITVDALGQITENVVGGEANNMYNTTINCMDPPDYKCYTCQNTVGLGGSCTSDTANCCTAGLACIKNKCSVPVCMDYEADYAATKTQEPRMCEMCPIGCRLDGISAYSNESCRAATVNGTAINPCDSDHCPVACIASAIPTTPVCEPYIGNGRLAAADNQSCYGPVISGYVDCPSITNNVSCIGNASRGCMWVQTNSSKVPLAFRVAPFNDVSNCKQCPENCRISGSNSSCTENAGTMDCSESACPSVCKRPITISAACEAYSPANANCKDCPALCRRDPETGDQPSSCSASQSCASSCSSDCWLEKAETRLCDSCFDCPMDCTYYPGVRTDCAEVCTDEALAGPVNIAPDDFIKALPGAAGQSDAKNVGLLMVPALVLPLFNIVIVVAFIRVFSPILGGDIEIPGLSRII